MIKFDNVSRRYADGQEALSNIGFEVSKGELAFVTGHSGASRRVRAAPDKAGLLKGLSGGILAVLLQAIVLHVFNSNFELLMPLYESEFQLQGFGPGNALSIIISGGTVGWVAALLASLRHSIDP